VYSNIYCIKLYEERRGVSMDIENMATSAVIQAIAKTDYLTPYVNSGDKEPSWDGNIYAYSNASKRKQYFLGKAPIQVKGKLCRELSGESIKYPVSAIDLRNYRMEGGTIYFVVHLTETKEKIYYHAILPFELNKLLKEDDKRNKLSMTFYELPSNSKEVSNIILNFVRDRDKQVLLRKGKNISLEELIKGNDLKSISYSLSYTGIGYDKDKPYEYLFSHDVYMYAEIKKLNVSIPIDHLWRAEIATTQLSGNVCIRDKVYYEGYDVDVVHKLDCDELHIGKSIIFQFAKEGKYKVNYKLLGNLSERIIAKEFILELLEYKIVTINGIEIEINATDEEIQKFYPDKIKKHLAYLKMAQRALIMAGVKKPLECEGLTKKDDEYVKMLIYALIEKRHIEFNGKKIPAVAFIEINNLRILLYFKEQDDGKYELKNFSEQVGEWSSDYVDGTMFPTSKYTMFQKDDFLNISNIDYEDMIKDMMKYENMGNYTRCNNNMLEMLKAYDENKNDRLLESAIQIAQWLINKESFSDLSKINLYQCYIRKRSLKQSEEDELFDLIEKSSKNYSIILGAYIILGNVKLVNRYMERLTAEEQDSFKEYPIWTLMNK
jgi:hypothetical protein